jgi:hypothetical protein
LEESAKTLIPEAKVNCWSIHLFMYLHDAWKECVTQRCTKQLIDKLGKGEVESLLGGSLSTLYHVAGWLLFRMRKRLTSKEHKHVIQEFVLQHSLATEEELVQLRPYLRKIDQKEIRAGRLIRCGLKWFQFIQGIEALYCANLTPANALSYQASILKVVKEAIAASKWLENLFLACVSTSIDPDGQQYLLKVYRSSVLPSYAMMKDRDVVRRIQARKSSLETVGRGLTTRQLVEAATIAAQKKE